MSTPYKKYVKRPFYSAARVVAPRGSAVKAGRYVGKTLGRYVNQQTAGMINAESYGKKMGGRLGKQFQRITGVGSYYVNNNRSIMNPKTAYAPRVKNSDEDVVIARTEYVGDVISGLGAPTDFTSTEYQLNPGMSVADGGLFNFLPNLAQNFAHYKFEQCVLEYRPTSGNATGANTALGTVFMCASYVPSDNPCESKLEALNSQYAISGAPSKTLLFPIECKSSTQNLKMHQVRSGPLKDNQNIDLFDFARVQVCSEGIQTQSQQLGELWITYKVRLSKYKYVDPINETPVARLRWAGSTQNISNIPLGNTTTVALVPMFGSFNVLLDFGLKRMVFPKGTPLGIYMITCNYQFGSAVARTPPTISTDGVGCVDNDCIFPPEAISGQVHDVANYASLSSIRISHTFIFRIVSILPSGGTYLQFQTTAIADFSNCVAMDYTIIQLNGDMFQQGL